MESPYHHSELLNLLLQTVSSELHLHSDSGKHDVKEYYHSMENEYKIENMIKIQLNKELTILLLLNNILYSGIV